MPHDYSHYIADLQAKVARLTDLLERRQFSAALSITADIVMCVGGIVKYISSVNKNV